MTKLQKALWEAFGVALALVPAYLEAHIAGPDPRNTTAPGDAPLGCATAQCHTASPQGGPLNAHSGYGVTATFSSGLFYSPGVPITISVNVTDPVNTQFGFQMTARLESDLQNGQAGDFTPGANQIVKCDIFGALKGPGGCPANQQVQFIEHSFLQPPASATPYTFTWTPPATNVGNIHFYVAGNAVNGDDMADGSDHVYTNTYVLSPAQAQTPSVCAGCVVDAFSFAKDANGHGTAVAPGSIVAIFGTFPGATSADFTNVPVNTYLGGATVTFGGHPAPLFHVRPGGAYPFISAQVPFEALAGQTQASVDVVVTVNGAPSAPTAIPIAQASPGVASVTATGQGNAELVFIDPADGIAKFAAPASASGRIGYPTAPIPRGYGGGKGQVAFIYVTGLGAMTAPVPNGYDGLEAPIVSHQANATPVVWIGGVNTGVTAQVLYAGQAPGYPGVNQINIAIPNAAPVGDAIPIQIQTADSAIVSQTGATIAIR